MEHLNPAEVEFGVGLDKLVDLGNIIRRKVKRLQYEYDECIMQHLLITKYKICECKHMQENRESNILFNINLITYI